MKAEILYLIKFTILFAMLTCVVHQSYGQKKGVLSGMVIEKTTGTPLPFATIMIEGTNTGVTSNMDGEYRLTNVPIGTTTIVYSFVSYESARIEVDMNEGDTKVLNVELEEGAIGLAEVVVTAQLMGQRKAISQQINSDALVNVVSSDKIRELPDANAAEAIGRISGVSVKRDGGEASKVFLRGLSPNLTSVTMNGVRLPGSGSDAGSADGDTRSVDLSGISPELLSSIEVFKSPTADMDGDAIGGIINLGLMKAPDERRLRARLYGGYNGLINEPSNYRGSLSMSQRFMDNKLGVTMSGNFENTNRSSESSSVRWNNSDTLTDYTVETFKLNNARKVIQRAGFNTQLDYQYGSGSVIGQFLYTGKGTETKVIGNTIGLRDVDHNPRHSKTKLETYQVMLSGEQRMNWLKANWVMAKSKTISDNYYDVQMVIDQFGGVDELSGLPFSVDELYDNQNYNYSNARLNSYSWEPSLMEHENLTLSLDLTADFKLGNSLSGLVKIGGKYRQDDRVRDHDHQRQNWYYLRPDVRNEAADLWPYELIRGGTSGDHIMIDNFYTPGNERGERDDQYQVHPEINFNTLDEWHYYQQSTLTPQYADEDLKYRANEKVRAAYIMAKLKYKDWLIFIPGLRYEGSDNSYTGRVSSLSPQGDTGSASDTTSYQKYGEWLPNAHVKIKPKDWFDIRLSVVKTLARPNYNMLTPRANINLTKGTVKRGNPNLKHSEAWNYDAYFSFYPNKIGLITIGGFYKRFDNYFTKTVRVMSAEEAVSLGYPFAVYDVEEDYINFDKSKVYGIEFEIQTNLSHLTGILRGIVLTFNTTHIWSETLFPRFERVTYYDPNLRLNVIDTENSAITLTENKLPDQVDWQSNLSIGYDYKGFSVRLSTIYQYRYLSSFDSQSEPGLEQFNNRYNDSSLRFDASISQRIGKNLKIMGNIANITGTNEIKYQYLSKYRTSEINYGTTIDLGLQFKL
ncbi:MAG: TonB-dependent receptor [Reichenbachiella sp.]